jgi:hypothetical protein
MLDLPRRLRQLVLPLLLCSVCTQPSLAAKETFYAVGAAGIDITPDYPIRLSGYGGRQKESEGIDQHLFAKALAIGSSKRTVAVLITVDNVAVPAYMREEVAARLAKKAGVRNERIAVCCTHTHTAPMLKDVCPNLFGADIPPEHQARIDRYTRELTDKLEQVALAALKDRRPATLSWGRTKAGFAWNRRPQGGPVDQDLPVLVARDKSGNIRAIYVSYACHCTTMADTPNHLCGDWAGFAQEYLERDHPGAVALVSLGCGADADPKPRTGLEFAKQNGSAISTAVNQLLRQPLTPLHGGGQSSADRRSALLCQWPWTPLHGKLECRAKPVVLPFDAPLAREEWVKRSQSVNHWLAYHAKKNLDRLDRGETLPTELPYLVQTWNFGQELALVFLPGEVVVDYSLRLKREYARLWVNGYANDVPCYIPSRRIWREGGYEGGDAMIYFDRPTRLAEGTEDRIIAALHGLLPQEFLAVKSNRAR